MAADSPTRDQGHVVRWRSILVALTLLLFSLVLFPALQPTASRLLPAPPPNPTATSLRVELGVAEGRLSAYLAAEVERRDELARLAATEEVYATRYPSDTLTARLHPAGSLSPELAEAYFTASLGAEEALHLAQELERGLVETLAAVAAAEGDLAAIAPGTPQAALASARLAAAQRRHETLLQRVAEAYATADERRAIVAALRVRYAELAMLPTAIGATLNEQRAFVAARRGLGDPAIAGADGGIARALQQTVVAVQDQIEAQERGRAEDTAELAGMRWWLALILAILISVMLTAIVLAVTGARGFVVFAGVIAAIALPLVAALAQAALALTSGVLFLGLLFLVLFVAWSSKWQPRVAARSADQGAANGAADGDGPRN